jgi:hypothetical protein
MSLLPTTTIYEVGCQIRLTGSSSYSRGVVNPVFCGGPSVRTGLPTTYCYVDIGGGVCTVSSPDLTNKTQLALRTIVANANTVRGSVAYSAGLPPKRSDGTEMTSCCCPASTIPSPTCQLSVYGVYPYFWGYSATTPTIGQTLINVANTAGQKCVGYSSGDVVVTNYNVVGKYIWLAIPEIGSVSKTKWQGGNSGENKGTIPDPDGMFKESEVITTVNSPDSCWSGINYRFYVSSYPTSINYSMTFKNS